MLKLKTLKFFFSVCISVLILFCLFIYFYNQNSRRKCNKLLLGQAQKIINENVVNYNSETNPSVQSINENEIFSAKKIEEDGNIVGMIEINKIALEAPIMDGTSQDVLKIAVGHFQNTSYWNGNVALASHNRGSYAHYFENLYRLSVGDLITYKTKLGTRLYIVNEVNQVSENDLSVLNQTENNTLTLITCIKGKPDFRLCVKAAEKT